MTQTWLPDARETVYDGWVHVFCEGKQLHRRFRDERGQYIYGLKRLSARTADALVDELLERDDGSAVSFAVIAPPPHDWEPRRTAAFRHDLDFYVFTGVTSDVFSALERYLVAPSAVLCFATTLRA